MKGLKDSLRKLRERRGSRRSNKYQRSISEREALNDGSAKKVAYLESLPKVFEYKNYLLPGDVIHSKVLDELPDLEVRESDIFIVSYPQSSSLLIEEIVLKIVTKVNDKIPSRRERVAQVAKLEVDNPYGYTRWLKGLKSPRILTSNLPLDLMPDSVKQTVCNVIYFLRNPKDHAVAYYYHHRVKGILSSFNDFIELYMNGDLLYGDYFNHVISYWQLSQLYAQNVLFISFEEIKIETHAMTKLIVDFLGYDLTDEEINEIIDSIPKLKRLNDGNNGVNGDNAKQSNFEGVLGDWYNYFSPEQSRQMDELVKSRLEKIGLSLCFDPIEALKRLKMFGRIIIDSSIDYSKGRTKRIKSDSSTSSADRPDLTKDEVLLLRNMSKIEMFSIEDEEVVEDSCWVMGWQCLCWLCFCPKSAYNKV